jgi:hypothetical protein
VLLAEDDEKMVLAAHAALDAVTATIPKEDAPSHVLAAKEAVQGAREKVRAGSVCVGYRIGKACIELPALWMGLISDKQCILLDLIMPNPQPRALPANRSAASGGAAPCGWRACACHPRRSPPSCPSTCRWVRSACTAAGAQS